MRKLGHDLNAILDEIMKNYFKDYKRPQYAIDHDFLKNNADFKELLFIISEFGKKSRYYNFDIITENEQIPLNTKELWTNFENRLLLKNEGLLAKLFNQETEQEVFNKLNSTIIVIFERFVSALSRQFIMKCLGEEAKQISINSFFDFGMIYEKDLGIRDYRKQTTRYKEAPRKVHKRTFADDVERKINPNYKHKKIHKSEYNGDWPFYADEVIIECRDKYWCIVTIDGHDYALNGSAKARYKLENPSDAGMSIIGKTWSDFIQMAKDI